MYKAFRKDKKYSIAFNTFPITAKEVASVYTTGFHKWDTFEDTTYSVVIHRFRIMIYKKKPNCGECAG